TSLMRVGYVGAAAAIYLATAGAEEGRRLAGLTASGGLARLGRVFGEALDALATTGDVHAVYRDHRNRPVQARQRAQAAVRSVARLDDALARDALVARLTDHVGAIAEAHVATLDAVYRNLCEARGLAPQPPAPPATAGASRVPVRKIYGPLRPAYLLDRLPP